LENINQAIAYHDKSLKLTETILKRFENNEIDINYKEKIGSIHFWKKHPIKQQVTKISTTNKKDVIDN
jgi:hypothetical protein